jgi:hypothetical protein
MHVHYVATILTQNMHILSANLADGGIPAVTNWNIRYANDDYEAHRQEYIHRYVRPGKKDTPEAKQFYSEQVAPRKPKPFQPITTPAPAPQEEQLSFEGMPSTDFAGMDPEKAMMQPHYLGPGWTP